jgi:serine protease Do
MNMGELGERIRKSTVVVRTQDGQGSGSGVIWDREGRIVTNAHVATTAFVEVEYWDQRRFRGQVLERDGLRDLALIQTLPSGAPALPIRETPALREGEPAVAVGNPLGFVGALSAGKVLGLRGDWLAAEIRLAPGNSGGPLADEEGRLIGINSMITAQGLALAVPTAAVVHFVRHGAPPRLGVSVRPTPVKLNGESIVGLEIVGIEEASPAQAASLRNGDVLLEDARSLQSKLRAGGVAKIRFLRGSNTSPREVAVVPTQRVLV